MKKKTTILAVAVLTIMIAIMLTGCFGNASLSDGFTSDSNTFNYVLTQEAGTYILHEVQKWADTDSDALGVTTKCCNNRLWTSYNAAILYRDMPKNINDSIIICK